MLYPTFDNAKVNQIFKAYLDIFKNTDDWGNDATS